MGGRNDDRVTAMAATEEELDRLQVSGAARLMAMAMDHDPSWSEKELGAMLAHQWSSDLMVDLRGLAGVDVRMVEQLAQAATPPIRTFADLLWHEQPPVQLLNWVKEFAKQAAGHPSRPLPLALSKALYSLTILVARWRGLRISTQSDTALIRGGAWLLGQTWIDQATRDLVRRCLE